MNKFYLGQKIKVKQDYIDKKLTPNFWKKILYILSMV